MTDQYYIWIGKIVEGIFQAGIAALLFFLICLFLRFAFLRLCATANLFKRFFQFLVFRQSFKRFRTLYANKSLMAKRERLREWNYRNSEKTLTSKDIEDLLIMAEEPLNL